MRISMQWFILILFCSLSASIHGQTIQKELDPGYYVVVGAYAPTKEDNAKHFAEVLQQRGYTSDYGFNASRNLYFVYIHYFTALKPSIKKMEEVRASKKFVDAWVRVVPGYIPQNQQPEKNNAAVQNETTDTANRNVDQTTQEAKAGNATTSSAATPANAASSSNADSTSTDIKENEPIKQYNPMTLANTEVFLSLYNARNNRIVDGDVQVIDTERSRMMTKVKGNEYLKLPDPKSKSGQLTLICEVFGYRKLQEEINYPLPLADTVKPHVELWGTTLVITFDLIRYQVGDIAILYNVFFYKDAAIMMPESKYELNNLLDMMKENPKYRIALHGHTNGNYHGKIISMGPGKDFFSLANATESLGTAKDLSEKRAEVIKEWLVQNGIDGSRIEVRSWGGKKPLYDKEGVNAGKNVRVEVELLSE